MLYPGGLRGEAQLGPEGAQVDDGEGDRLLGRDLAALLHLREPLGARLRARAELLLPLEAAHQVDEAGALSLLGCEGGWVIGGLVGRRK